MTIATEPQPWKPWNFDHALPRKINAEMLARCRAVSIQNLQAAINSVRRMADEGEDVSEVIAGITARYLANVPAVRPQKQVPKVKAPVARGKTGARMVQSTKLQTQKGR